MPKIKTHRAAAKRFKVTGTNKIKRHRAGHSHILTSKNRKRKKRLSQSTLVSRADYPRIAKLLGM
ncbi:MAG: 50S ribosomal protein L35 [Candidatus Cloacimonadales bacterium]|jgi:large subunit ribosomal protein L35|nr:50S ribosomal protein L35 [Candidatus Cloacimonadota bacterium]MDD2649676.1 50S ribosomal protein L35 [Candidatus Cloacimonadota bacterium]MDD3502036.1 50S ribosomal protein L35 [Candidatus Cloacimonadota bacterium]MDX9978022.1 50S ribosomal protein L35 [Candidatus Cloacimonadales bacterium]